MSHNERDFATRIRALGYRMTPQRQLILDVICERDGHASMSEICGLVHERSPLVDRATVYRTVQMLTNHGLLVSARIQGATRWDIAEETPHHHLVCTTCGSVKELGNHHFEELVSHLLQDHNFHADINHLTVEGVCGNCHKAI